MLAASSPSAEAVVPAAAAGFLNAAKGLLNHSSNVSTELCRVVRWPTKEKRERNQNTRNGNESNVLFFVL